MGAAMTLGEDLERLIDRDGIENVLTAIGMICYDKSDHILSNWQDSATARWWYRIAQHLSAIRYI